MLQQSGVIADFDGMTVVSGINKQTNKQETKSFNKAKNIFCRQRFSKRSICARTQHCDLSCTDTVRITILKNLIYAYDVRSLCKERERVRRWRLCRRNTRRSLHRFGATRSVALVVWSALAVYVAASRSLRICSHLILSSRWPQFEIVDTKYYLFSFFFF